MAKTPIKWNKEAVKNLGYTTGAGAAFGAALGATTPASMLVGLAGGAAIGGVAGMVDNYRAKREKHRALGRQFKD
jgi:hypothetical protein